MRWKGRRGSENIEDRRGAAPRRAMVGGGIGTVVLVILVMVLGGDPSALLQGGATPQPSPPAESADPESLRDDPRAELVSVTLADTEDVWNELFQAQLGRQYVEPTLVLFTESVQSGCGYASAQVGPFYCPADSTVYIDLSFFDQLRQQFGAPGDFAQAYVIAHEVGHHVQNLLGATDIVNRARGRASQEEVNQLSVRLELQADFYAGVWAHHARSMAAIDSQDIEEALNAAAAIGDDTLQRRGQGHVVPETFTHGTSEQRARWFRRGWESGQVKDGDTFSARNL